MSRTPVVGAVCHQLDISGSYSQRGDIFICTSCQAVANQLIEIQDSIWPVAGDTDRPSDETPQPTPAPLPAE